MLLFIGAVIVVDALVGEKGLLAMRKARQEYRALEASLSAAKMENSRLREEARRLREDPRAVEDMARRRGGMDLRELTNGPGKLARAFGIGLEHDGANALSGPLRVERRAGGAREPVLIGPRVGIRKAAELPYRFWFADHPHVTRTPLNRRAIVRPR